MRSRQLLRCNLCRLPPDLCLCSTLPQLAIRTQVVVVATRTESVRSSNTGRLATLVLQGSRYYVSGDRGVPAFPPLGEAPRLLLFPFEGARVLSSVAPSEPHDKDQPPALLLVPDGSWSQARRIAIRAVRDLGAEPVMLPKGDAPLPGLRKPPSDASLCTFQATARALSLLEGDWIGKQMLPVLREFVERNRSVRRNGLTSPVRLVNPAGRGR